jgi:hypothetical protein
MKKVIPALIFVFLLCVPVVSAARIDFSGMDLHSRPSPPLTDLTNSCTAVAGPGINWQGPFELIFRDLIDEHFSKSVIFN